MRGNRFRHVSDIGHGDGLAVGGRPHRGVAFDIRLHRATVQQHHRAVRCGNHAGLANRCERVAVRGAAEYQTVFCRIAVQSADRSQRHRCARRTGQSVECVAGGGQLLLLACAATAAGVGGGYRDSFRHQIPRWAGPRAGRRSAGQARADGRCIRFFAHRRADAQRVQRLGVPERAGDAEIAHGRALGGRAGASKLARSASSGGTGVLPRPAVACTA